MKKILIILSIMLLSLVSSVCIAIESPRWVGQPITFYIPERGELSELMQRAFFAWQNKSNSLVKFKRVNKPSDANIEVVFVEFVTNCNSSDAVGCTETVIRGHNYVKARITIATKDLVVIKNPSGKIVSKQKLNRSKEHLYGTMLHEVGHSIGLKHSNNPKSIMFQTDLNSIQSLTQEDLRLLIQKYR